MKSSADGLRLRSENGVGVLVGRRWEKVRERNKKENIGQIQGEEKVVNEKRIQERKWRR